MVADRGQSRTPVFKRGKKHSSVNERIVVTVRTVHSFKRFSEVREIYRNAYIFFFICHLMK